MKKTLTLLTLSILVGFSANAHAKSQKLTPSAATADYCSNHAWGSETKLNNTCERLYNSCKANISHHKGCKPFVQRWDYLIKRDYE